MKYVLLLALFVLLLGCTSQQNTQNPNIPTNPTQPNSIGSANFQRCMTQCDSGVGSGEFCKDGCKVQEAEDTRNTSFCDSLYKKENIPSCYGTVAKSAGDRSICNRLTNTTQRDLCTAIFGAPGTS